MAFSRRGQQWVLDNLLRAVGNDVLFPGVDAFRLERGYKLSDLKHTFDRIKSFRASSREWQRTAEKQVALAAAAEAAGHTETARGHYFRATLYYSRAQWSIFQDNARKRDLLSRCHACYDKVIAYQTDCRIERVEIPFGDKSLTGLLHLPNGAKEPLPCVLFTPGMDMTKEEFPAVDNNYFARRGVALLSIDGPGQGESHFRGIKVNLTNYEAAGRAAFDYLSTRPDIDSKRIGVFGVSMGSYWAPRIAAFDNRFAACAAALGCYMQKDTIFNQAQPTFKRRYMYMAGITDEDEFDKMADQMTLDGLEDRLTMPLLMVTGELDELCPVEDAYALYEKVPSPKAMWVYENEFHPMGGVIADILPAIADWLLDALNGKLPASLDDNRYIKE